MHDDSYEQTMNDYWGREGLEQAILDTLRGADTNLDDLTIDDLAPLDQYHGGGKRATVRLARRAGLAPGTRVLDVGGGLGGPARTLAVEFGCQVTSVDLTESYMRTAAALTARLKLSDRVTHRVANALALPFGDGEFDVVWTQNSGMTIADKSRLYAGFHRVIRTGGRLVFQEPMAGPVQPLVFPVMWARDASDSFLLPPERMRELIEGTGFRMRAWYDVTEERARPSGASPPYSIQRLVMGDFLDDIRRAGERNRAEGRSVMVHAVFKRMPSN